MSLNGNLISEIIMSRLVSRPTTRPIRQIIKHQRGRYSIYFMSFVFGIFPYINLMLNQEMKKLNIKELAS